LYIVVLNNFKKMVNEILIGRTITSFFGSIPIINYAVNNTIKNNTSNFLKTGGKSKKKKTKVKSQSKKRSTTCKTPFH
jgi:hypothetical protein